jgi:hypothetical protein
MAPFSTALWLRLAALAACLPVLGCQSSSLTLPGDAAPANVHVFSGSGQQGTVGGQISQPLVVRVTDASDRPVRNASLDFVTQVPGAELDPPTRATDDSGKAEVRVRLGTVEGIQIVEARLAQDVSLRAIFTLTAVVDDPPDDGLGGEDDDDGGGNGDGDGPGGGHDDEDDGDDDDEDDHDD